MNTELLNEHETGLVENALIATNSTDVAHFVDVCGESACGELEYDLDKIRERDDGRLTYGMTTFYGQQGLIHIDDRWYPRNKRLCRLCQSEVPDHLIEDVLTDEKFGHVEGLEWLRDDGH